MKGETYKKILVIRFSSLGDVILTTPALKSIRQNFPQSEIHFLTKEEYKEILLSNPNVNKIITISNDAGFDELKRLKIHLKDYDLIVDLHNNLRSFYLRLFSSAKKAVFKKYSLRKFLLVKFKINLMKELPSIAERYLKVLYKLGIRVEYIQPLQRGILPEIFTTPETFQSLDSKLSQLLSPDSRLILIFPSAKHFTKTYSPEYFAELINKFDAEKFSFVLVGKGNDKKNINIIKAKTGENVYDLCDQLNALELFELMKRCSLVISGDTGPMHIAEAANVPLIMIAGSSVKEFGFYPQNEKAIIIENEQLKCRPCSHVGRSECPLGHFKCIMELKPESILNEVKNLLLN